MSKPTAPSKPQVWSPEAKLKAVCETNGMNAAEIEAYCLKNGLRPKHLSTWRETFIANLKPELPSTTREDSKESEEELVKIKEETKKLEQKLRKIEKALAENRALLKLKAKADKLWGKKKD